MVVPLAIVPCGRPAAVVMVPPILLCVAGVALPCPALSMCHAPCGDLAVDGLGSGCGVLCGTSSPRTGMRGRSSCGGAAGGAAGAVPEGLGAIIKIGCPPNAGSKQGAENAGAAVCGACGICDALLCDDVPIPGPCGKASSALRSVTIMPGRARSASSSSAGLHVAKTASAESTENILQCESKSSAMQCEGKEPKRFKGASSMRVAMLARSLACKHSKPAGLPFLLS